MGPLAIMAIVQAGSSILSGISGLGAANDEANRLQQNAAIALREARQQAEQEAMDITAFQSRQAHTYASSGITLEGSPAIVLEQTRLRGQMRVDSIIRAGMSQSNLYNLQAQQVKRSARNAMIGALFGAAGSAATTYMKGNSINAFGNQAVSLSASPIPPVTTPNGAM